MDDPTTMCSLEDSMVGVKLRYGKEFRRFQFSRKGTLAELAGCVYRMFQDPVQLKYYDEDGDEISLDCDIELTEAMEVAKETGCLRLIACPSKKSVRHKTISNLASLVATAPAPSSTTVMSTAAAPSGLRRRRSHQRENVAKASAPVLSTPTPAPAPAFDTATSAAVATEHTVPVSFKAIVPQLAEILAEKIVPAISRRQDEEADLKLLEAEKRAEDYGLLLAETKNEMDGLNKETSLLEDKLHSLETNLDHINEPFQHLQVEHDLLKKDFKDLQDVNSSLEKEVSVRLTHERNLEEEVARLKHRIMEVETALMEQRTRNMLFRKPMTKTKARPRKQTVYSKVAEEVAQIGREKAMKNCASAPDLAEATSNGLMKRRSRLNCATFVSDENLDDGTVVTPGHITKLWKMKNTGKYAWPDDTVLRFINGNMTPDNAASVPVPSAAPNEEVVVHAEMRVPSAAGRYRSTWRLSTGAPRSDFGHRLWCDVVVLQSPLVPKPTIEQEQEQEQTLTTNPLPTNVTVVTLQPHPAMMLTVNSGSKDESDVAKEEPSLSASVASESSRSSLTSTPQPLDRSSSLCSMSSASSIDSVVEVSIADGREDSVPSSPVSSPLTGASVAVVDPQTNMVLCIDAEEDNASLSERVLSSLECDVSTPVDAIPSYEYFESDHDSDLLLHELDATSSCDEYVMVASDDARSRSSSFEAENQDQEQDIGNETLKEETIIDAVSDAEAMWDKEGEYAQKPSTPVVAAEVNCMPEAGDLFANNVRSAVMVAPAAASVVNNTQIPDMLRTPESTMQELLPHVPQAEVNQVIAAAAPNAVVIAAAETDASTPLDNDVTCAPTPAVPLSQETQSSSPSPSTADTLRREAFLGTLFEMGFFDRALNNVLLTKHENDLQKVVTELVTLSSS